MKLGLTLVGVAVLLAAVLFSRTKRVQLRVGEAHIVDNFLPPEELKEIVAFYSTSEPDMWERKKINGAWVDRWVRLVDTEDAYRSRMPRAVRQVSEKILSYAERHLSPATAQPGSYAWNGELHLSFVMMYRYYMRQRLSPHADTDFPSRCVSAALYLSRDTVGGALQLLQCREPHVHAGCVHRSGVPLKDFYRFLYGDEDGVRRDPMASMEVLQEIEPRFNRLVFFLSETFHSVSGITNGTRHVLFNWLGCNSKCACEPEFVDGNAPCPSACWKRFGDL